MSKSTRIPDNLEPILAAAIAIGKELEPEARPYYAAYLRPLEALHPQLLPKCIKALGVTTLPVLAFLLDERSAACGRNDRRPAATIDAEFEAAGVSHLVRAALHACKRLSALLPSLLPNRTGTKH